MFPYACSCRTAALYAVAPVDPLAFANAANVGRLTDAGPMLASLAAAEPDPLARTLLGDAAAASNALRGQASVESLIASLTAELTAVCEGAVNPRRTTCSELGASAPSAFIQLRGANPARARDLLLSLARAAEEAGRRGVIAPLDATMISGSAGYLATRV